ncbi:MAG: hypothetical protein DI598_10915 [Pseudopedobacter saltans]|uniref:Pirin domain protein n=1 Tax=Pseudopedobacter saltans TaxID=151895 RepID=A0A2W5GNS6_9SPHI|nr:MAG: hypothetical protein DI598_10915 [Pseudopedobacter saltans]
MSNIGLILEEKAADIGNFLVGRLLPFRQKRSVGPFVFIDHMGPTALKDYQNMDVAPHPHIGLSTLTYLFEGAIRHQDSMGNDIVITPGAVNWMTAGKGVSHSERTPEYMRHTEKVLHGFQLWVALPKSLENGDSSFTHTNAEDIPSWEDSGVFYKLIAGKAAGHQSPVPVYSDLFFLEIHSDFATEINIGKELYGESALYVLDGTVEIEGQEYGSKQLLIAKEAQLCTFKISAGATVYIFGGQPFEEERFIYWNFVNSDRSVIEKAKEDWIAHRFPKVPGDDGYVPIPGS